MNSFTIEQSIAKLLNDIMESAAISSEYVSGRSISTLLEHVVNGMLYNKSHVGKVEDLWGPEWSVFLVMIAHRIQPRVSGELILSGVKEILRRMVGHSDITPFTAIAAKTGVPVDEVGSSAILVIYEVVDHVDMASEICNDLGIPTPEEMMYMYCALGYECRLEATQLYNMKTPDGKPITEHNAYDMVMLMRAGRTVKKVALQTEEVVKRIRQTSTWSREEAEEIAIAVEEIVSAAICAERDLVLAENNLSSSVDLKPDWPHHQTPVNVDGIGDIVTYALVTVAVALLVFGSYIMHNY